VIKALEKKSLAYRQSIAILRLAKD